MTVVAIVMMVMVMLLLKAFRSRWLPGVRFRQLIVQSSARASLQKIQCMRNNIGLKQRGQILAHGFNAPRESDDEHVCESAGDWARERSEWCLFERRREKEVDDARCLALYQLFHHLPLVSINVVYEAEQAAYA